MIGADEVIQRLGLKPHPTEGGWYAETWRAGENLPAQALPERYGSSRAFGTAIYYLVTEQGFSALHRLKSDEIFHFYFGESVQLLQLLPGGKGLMRKLGHDILSGELPQCLVPAGVWQGSRLLPGGRHGFALLGCTVAPGFDFADYEHGSRSELLRAWPDFSHEINVLTRE
jgi:predicted cupin superfamily sugar epimerase